MTGDRPVSPTPPAGGVRVPRPQHAKPDPRPMRLAFGMAGLASATALLTAMLPSVTPSQVAVADAVAVDTTVAAVPEPSVIHVLKTVTLEAGQTAPPDSSVVVRPQPTPRIVVKTVTRQSGK